jgi:hypothetical protein
MNRFSMEFDTVVARAAELIAGYSMGNIRINDTNEEYVVHKLADAFCKATRVFAFSSRRSEICGYVADFFQQYLPSIPDALKNQLGATGDSGLLPLYLCARAIEPDLLVESGVYIGASLHMFSNALEKLSIYAFDVNLGNLQFKPDNVELNEMDWSESMNLPTGANALAFFDDHINCAKRILECRERRFRWAIFDDSPTLGHLIGYRYPAVPSVPMILDEDLPDGCIFEWHHQATNTRLRYTHNLDLCRRARTVIRNAASLDCFSGVNGMAAGDKWLVELDPD